MINNYDDINLVQRINGQLVINPTTEALGVAEVVGNREYDWCVKWEQENGDIGEVTTSPEVLPKVVLAEALASIAYNLDTSTTVDVRDLTDVAGRIVQARPQDEQNIRNGMRAIELSGASSINWVMLDNTKQAVTSAELQTVLDAGILRGLQVWDGYDPA